MPAIEVSCPSCGKVNIIETKPHEPIKGGMVEMFDSIAAGMGLKKYAFEGEVRCLQCGEIIDVCISVSNRIKREGIPLWGNMQAIQP